MIQINTEWGSTSVNTVLVLVFDSLRIVSVKQHVVILGFCLQLFLFLDCFVTFLYSVNISYAKDNTLKSLVTTRPPSLKVYAL